MLKWIENLIMVGSVMCCIFLVIINPLNFFVLSTGMGTTFIFVMWMHDSES